MAVACVNIPRYQIPDFFTHLNGLEKVLDRTLQLWQKPTDTIFTRQKETEKISNGGGVEIQDPRCPITKSLVERIVQSQNLSYMVRCPEAVH